MRHFMGIDAGGTKTFCLIGDEEGRIEGFGKAGPGNYEAHGVEAAAVENRKAIQAALDDVGIDIDDIDSIGMGIAGADIPEDYEMLEREIYTPLFGDKPRVFHNDSMAGLRGGTRDPFGIVIACGTGCVCAGVNRAGRHTRVGGINEDFGDQCSGSSIGMEGFKAVWRARDGIIEHTRLVDLFVRRAGVADVDELFDKCYHGTITYDDLEPMAKLVFDAAFDRDATACDILEWGGGYLGLMVNAVARELDMSDDEFDVVMAGSVFKGSSPVLIDTMRTVIHRQAPRARTVMPAFEPVVGALLLGMEKSIEITDSIYGTLSEELIKAEKRYNVKFRAE